MPTTSEGEGVVGSSRNKTFVFRFPETSRSLSFFWGGLKRGVAMEGRGKRKKGDDSIRRGEGKREIGSRAGYAARK